MALWRPTPKDIFKSRWKRFYKRCYRPRSAGNAVDRPPPHDQAYLPHDGVPSPWRLHFSAANFVEGTPSDARRSAYTAYKNNVKRYMLPSVNCNGPIFRDLVLRCLDRGQRGTCDSGLGRAETATFPADSGHAPSHLFNIIEGEAKRSEESQAFLETLQAPICQSETFAVRRLYELCEEWELVWEGGLNDPRRGSSLRRSPPEGGPELKDRGRFPFVDEKASLIDDLGLREILRLAHRTSSRRHPKWREKVFWYKKFHSQYLRRKAMVEEEAKQRMGILKASLEA